MKAIQVSKIAKDTSLRDKPECFGEWCEFCEKDLCGGWFERCISASNKKN